MNTQPHAHGMAWTGTVPLRFTLPVHPLASSCLKLVKVPADLPRKTIRRLTYIRPGNMINTSLIAFEKKTNSCNDILNMHRTGQSGVICFNWFSRLEYFGKILSFYPYRIV
jgi:hypothetical protein